MPARSPDASSRRQRKESQDALLQETPQGRLQEQALKQLIGYQVAQASVVTLGVFDQVVGKPRGLRTVEYTILALVHANKVISPARLARALNISASYMTLAVNKLEGLGLIKREANETDRRAQRLALTPKGSSAVESMTAGLLKAEREAFSTLTAVEQMMLAELLHKLAASRRAPGAA